MKKKFEVIDNLLGEAEENQSDTLETSAAGAAAPPAPSDP